MGEDNERGEENADQVEQEETNGVVDVLDYATLLLSVIQDDIRHVQVRATASLAIAAVFVTQIPLGRLKALPDGFRWVTVVGIVVLAVAAACYFHYTQLLNRARLAIAGALPDARRTRKAVKTEWEERFISKSTIRPIALYLFAQFLFLTGAAAVSVVVAKLILP